MPEPHSPLSFPDWVRQRRRELDLTQAELAQRAGCAVSTIRKVERGALRPSRELAALLARALELPPDAGGSFVQAARQAAPGDAAEEQALPPHTSAPPTLPRPLTPLVGREQELAALLGRLADPSVRLLTLVGPGGVGKTRLAIAAGERLSDAQPEPPHLVFVALAALTDPRLVLAAIAEALQLKEAGVRGVRDTLVEALNAQPTLLILDNFEQLRAATRDLGDLLSACPRLRLLVTSRVVLSAYGEHVLPVAPLPPPPSLADDLAQLERNPAVLLFTQRARAANPAYALSQETAPAIAAICRRLDGLPLALELAAARSRLLSADALLARLDHALDLLTNGSQTHPPRHQTLRATLDWSYALLDARQQTLLARLGVFAEAASLPMIQAVCCDEHIPADALLDTVDALVASSLVSHVADAAGEPRFALLEVLREYVQERRAADPAAEEVQRRYVAHIRALAEQAEPELVGAEQRSWLDRLEQQVDHIRAVLQWACANDAGVTALQIAGALGRFWWSRGYLSEGRRWLRQALERSSGAPPASRAKGYYWAGILAVTQGDYHQALAVLSDSLSLYEQADDRQGTALALNALGVVANRRGDHALAQARYEESLQIAQESGNRERLATALNNLGYTLLLREQPGEARRHLRHSLGLSRLLSDVQGQGYALANLGVSWLKEGRPRRAGPLLRAGLERFEALGDLRNSAEALEGLAEVLLAEGDLLGAARLLGQAAGYREMVGAPHAPHEAARIERVSRAIQAGIGEATFAEAWSISRHQAGA